MSSLSDIWPLYDLELTSPRLRLRPIRDEDIPGLVEATLAGIHDADRMPFAYPWTREEPAKVALNTAMNVWEKRIRVSPDDWYVSFAIMRDGRVIGRQDVVARHFRELNTVETGSWLTRSEQGQGLGKEMRTAVLLWAFDHLGAQYAETAAMVWNTASQRVSEGLGYRPNGETLLRISAGEVEQSVRYRLERSGFRRPEWQLNVRGNDAVLRQFGLSGS